MLIDDLNMGIIAGHFAKKKNKWCTYCMLKDYKGAFSGSVITPSPTNRASKSS
jgi:hypothetical protein